MFTDTTVIIPFRGVNPHRTANLDFILKHLQSSLPGAQFCVADDPDPDKFNRGRAVNGGVNFCCDKANHRHGRRVLVIADGDVWLPKAALHEAIQRVRRGVPSYVVPFRKIIWFQEYWSKRVLEGWSPVAARPAAKENILLEWGQTSVGICNVVSLDNFRRFGGFDPRFRGWGFEDCAWDIVATTLGGKHTRLQHEGRHLWHPACESKEDPVQIAIGQELHRRYVAVKGNYAACVELMNETDGLEGGLKC